MSFIPQKISAYSAAELADFMLEGKVRLADINQLKNLSLFSAEELMTFISSGACVFADMQRCDLHFRKQQELRERLALWDIEKGFWSRAVAGNTPESYKEYLEAFPAGVMAAKARENMALAEEDALWSRASDRDNITLYRHYLASYPSGRYHFDAEGRLAELEEEKERLQTEILDDMRRSPWKYNRSLMGKLVYGGDARDTDQRDIASLPPGDVAARFVKMGLTISYDTLVGAGIIPSSISERELMTPEFQLPQVNNFDSFPQDRTDIYFLGVARSGKSSVLSGLFNAMTTRGTWRYRPNIGDNGQDGSMAYYNGLVRAMTAKKPPVPTAFDTINYINIDVPRAGGTRHTAELNFVEISGECFKTLSDSLGNGAEVWRRLGASRVLANNNRKVLFFLLDYNVILGNQDGITLYDQQEALQNALTIFAYDGTGRDHTVGCTLSKVSSVGVILTKADLMGTDDRGERQRIAREYLQNNFASFMSQLSDACRKFRINKADGYRPYVLTFSLGSFYVGNTVLFDPSDSMDLAATIERLAPLTKTSIF